MKPTLKYHLKHTFQGKKQTTNHKTNNNNNHKTKQNQN